MRHALHGQTQERDRAFLTIEKMNENELLLSYGVKSLFTSIPGEESLGMCQHQLKETGLLNKRTIMDVLTIISWLCFGLMTASIQYNGTHYQQQEGSNRLCRVSHDSIYFHRSSERQGFLQSMQHHSFG